MKKTIIGISAAILLAAPLAFVSADATTSTSSNPKWPRMQEKREEMKARWDDRRDALEQKREEIKNRFEEKRGELTDKRHQKIADILNRVVGRLQSAIDRLIGFADRIEARLALLEDEGLDMEASREHVDLAKEALDDAQEALNGIDLGDILDDFGTSTPSGAITELRTQLGAVREFIRSAHTHLIDAVSAIKAGLQRSDDSDNDN